MRGAQKKNFRDLHGDQTMKGYGLYRADLDVGSTSQPPWRHQTQNLFFFLFFAKQGSRAASEQSPWTSAYLNPVTGNGEEPERSFPKIELNFSKV